MDLAIKEQEMIWTVRGDREEAIAARRKEFLPDRREARGERFGYACRRYGDRARFLSYLIAIERFARKRWAGMTVGPTTLVDYRPPLRERRAEVEVPDGAATKLSAVTR
jgi:hypothetical protein